MNQQKNPYTVDFFKNAKFGGEVEISQFLQGGRESEQSSIFASLPAFFLILENFTQFFIAQKMWGR